MMLLWSLQVEYRGGSYSTQFEAESPKAAIQRLLASGSVAQAFSTVEIDHDGQFHSDEILYVIAMDGLDGMWLSQIGKSGTYVSVVIVNTVRSSTPSPEKDS